MDDAERFERLMEVIDDLAIENLETPIVVEGRRDVESLRILGCAGEIHPLNLGDSLHQRAEALASSVKLVILLTDWDRKGQQLFDAMTVRFLANGVKVDRSYREKIQLWMRPPVKDIESLAGYVARNLARYHEKELGE